MSEWKWTAFDQQKWDRQELPEEKRYILVQIASREDGGRGLPPAVAVGYLRFAAGDHDSPVFTIPGVGGEVVAWCDCLGDDFFAPLWEGKQKGRK